MSVTIKNDRWMDDIPIFLTVIYSPEYVSGYHLFMHSPLACEELEGLSPDMTLDQYVADQLKVWCQGESHHVHLFRIIVSCSNMLFIEKI